MNFAKPFALALLLCGVPWARGAEAPTPAAASTATSAAAPAKAEAKNDDVYLFAFFRNERDGLHLATSKDGLKWDALNGDKVFLAPQVGGRLMRDPTLFRGPNGAYHLVWTTSWTGQSIGYASSEDLIHWTPQQELRVMADFPDAQQSWAPEVRYDKLKDEYVIYWSSTVGAGRGTGPGAPYFKTYATTTKDFKTFTPTKVFFDAGFGEIDASILEDGGKFYLFFKHGGQGTQIASADALQGPYTDTGVMFAYPGSDQWEGAWPIKIGDDYYAYVDHYRSRNDRMGLWRSHDLKLWEDITAQTSGLRGISHGSVAKVPASLVENIVKATAAPAASAPAAPLSNPPAPPAQPTNTTTSAAPAASTPAAQ